MNKENDYYRKIWDIDFTTKEDLFKMNLLRNIEKEKQIESDITKTLHERFPFRFIPFQGQERRRIIGKEGLESRLIGTVAKCNVCKPSDNWLGRYSPVPFDIRSGINQNNKKNRYCTKLLDPEFP
jgi:hypothetical protein